MTCKVCKLPNKTVKKLEDDFINGVPISQIARAYGVSDNSVKFHTTNHLPEKIVKGAQKELEANSSNILGRIEELHGWIKIILERSLDLKHDRTALKAIAEARNTYALSSQMMIALHKIKVLEIETEKSQSLESNLPLERLTEKEKEVYFKITQKLLGDENTVDLEYTNEIEFPRVRKKVHQEPKEPQDVDEEEGKDVGASGVDEENSSEIAPAPESMTFKPLDQYDGRIDPKLKLSRRRFSRWAEQSNDQDPYSSNVT